MTQKRWFGDEDNYGHDDWHHGPGGSDHWHGGHDFGDDDSEQFTFDFPDQFKIDLPSFNLTKLGKITDCSVEPTELDITFGKKWIFGVTGSDFDVSLKSGHKLPEINDGTVSSFSVDGPGKLDFSISDLDVDAKQFTQALTHFDVVKLFNLVLGGDETISGSGFSDLLFGSKGNDTLLGNDGADQLLGGTGDDIINGGQQNDLLAGGLGADTFAFGPNSGMDLVLDFDPTTDKLDLTASGFTGDLSDLLGGHGGCHGNRFFGSDDVVLNLGDGAMIKLLGVSAWELNADNVLL